MEKELSNYLEQSLKQQNEIVEAIEELADQISNLTKAYLGAEQVWSNLDMNNEDLDNE